MRPSCPPGGVGLGCAFVSSRSRTVVLVADDEPLARRKICGLLRDVPWIDEILEAASGNEAIARIDSDLPDLVFLDVRMPGATGIEVLERTSHEPHVVFTTAYDRHAVTAFELNALDYLLKPFGEERFRLALERAHRELKRDRRVDEMDSGLPGRLRRVEEHGTLVRIFVRRGGRIVTIPVDDVHRFEATGDYVRLYTGERSHVVGVGLGDLEERLDPGRFLRIHRSHIVNLAFVKEFLPHPGSRYLVLMRKGEELVASRRRSREIRRRAL